MPLVVGVAFRPVTKVYYFDPAGFDDLQPGEHVVVETSRGRTLGQVVLAPRAVPDCGDQRRAEAGRAAGHRLGHGASRSDDAPRAGGAGHLPRARAMLWAWT